MATTEWTGKKILQWNLDLTKCQETVWGNLFVTSRVRYIEHLHLTNFRENYQNEGSKGFMRDA